MPSMGSSIIEQAIFDTVRYFDLFSMPVSAVQVWQCLIMPAREGEARWGGRAHVRLREVQDSLAASPWLKKRLSAQWGFYTLAGKTHLVARRLHRHSLAQDKWKIVRRSGRWLAAMPFVRSLAVSGSLALDNTKPGSDLDLFIIAAAGRVWTARLFLLLAAQLAGRRRKYWAQSAPDKLCLNHYVTDDALAVAPTVRNLYTAVQYSLHVPLVNAPVLAEFRRANAQWMHRYVMPGLLPSVPHLYTIRLPRWAASIKHQAEQFLLEPLGDVLESWARALQQTYIRRHLRAAQRGRIAANDYELAFHPDTKVPAILAAFYQDPGQQTLL